jgi:hypothetical protein
VIWNLVGGLVRHLKNPENHFSSTGIIPDADLYRFREPLASAYLRRSGGRKCGADEP